MTTSDLYDSVVSKLGTLVPMFAKSIIDMAIEESGYSRKTITPLQFQNLIDKYVNPRIKKMIGETYSLQTAGAGCITIDDSNNIQSITPILLHVLNGIISEKDVYDAEDFQRLVDLGILYPFNDLPELKVEEKRIAEINRYLNISYFKLNDNEIKRGVILIQDDSLRYELQSNIKNYSLKLEELDKDLKGINKTLTKTNIDLKRRTRELERAREETLVAMIALKLAKEQAEIAKNSAENASAIKSEFLANISHEIRTPMTGIIGFTDLLFDTDPSEDQKKYLEVLKSSADSLLELINNVLDISKIEANKFEIDRVEFDLKEMLEIITKVIDLKAQEKGLTFTINISSDVPRIVKSDSLILKQVLNNLLNNALKFTHKGSIGLKVDRTGNSDDGTMELCFSVTDTGIGIPGNQIGSIFEVFTQADGSITRKYGGTGLGLAISRSLVELLDGRIWVKSREGSGSTFSFTANLVPAEADSEPAEDQIPTAGPRSHQFPKNLKILLVEDNAINRMIISKLLSKVGLNPDFALNGHEAVDLTSQNNYDLILMDIMMPGCDGVEATRRIRERENGTGHVPIIALTAHAMKGDREKFLNNGMDDYLAKPVQPGKLYSVIERYTATLNDTPETNVHETSPTQPDPNILDMVRLTENYGLEKKNFVELFNLFITESHKNFEKIKKAVETNDNESLKVSAHALKGSSANMSADTVSDIALRFELMASSGTMDNAKEHLKNLEKALHETIGMMKKYVVEANIDEDINS